ncbi:MAG: insulinase family protein, partial [Phycisphaerae bacterium]|nr:insulinase family protein [Phycisphaerae bacterium]
RAARTELRVGHAGVARDNPDLPALQVLAAILGGGPVSRLAASLRQRLGLTYQIRSRFAARHAGGPFIVEAAVASGAAATALRLAREQGAYQRLYVALGVGALAVEHARWEWSLAPDRAPRVHKAVPKGQKSALPAASRVAVAATHGAYLALALAPETGRTHQLRVHAAAAGVPLVGDRIYGGPGRITTSTGAVRVPGRIALHCARVDIGLPGGHVSASSPIPPELAELAAFLGLDLAEALRCAP